MTVERAEALVGVAARRAPERVAIAPDSGVTVARVRCAFPAHAHEDSDDCFPIPKGGTHIDIGGAATRVRGPGQLGVVPKRRRHRPRVPKEAEIRRIGPLGLRDTNDADRVVARGT